jgi:hypothetical protein
MERGYVREEIFEECRKEIDGVDGSESMLPQDFRAKRRKHQAEVEFRDNISRSILKHIYQNVTYIFSQRTRRGEEAVLARYWL